jgi:hypothetical protein
MVQGDEGSLWQSNREIGAEDIAHICSFIKRWPRLSRTELIYTLCEHLGWLTAAGEPKYNACTKLLVRLEGRGEIVMPARSTRGGAPPSRVRALPQVVPGEPIACGLAQLAPVRLRLLREAPEEALCNAHLQQFHPLGYRKPFGYSARYGIESSGLSLGYVLLGGASKALEARDRWIGWSARERLAHLPWVVNNQRFLIYPWVRVANLASHVLGRLAGQLAADWQTRWGFAPLLLESFVDPAHYRGSSYRAAGWELLGHTSGRGLTRPGKHYRSSPKLIFVKPLHA